MPRKRKHAGDDASESEKPSGSASRSAPSDVRARKGEAASEVVPDSHSLKTLSDAAQGCRACPLGEAATQAVFGEGPNTARVMLIGEQPGNQEDLSGRPFVGPAGRMLDKALIEAGFERKEVFVTNAVKHFSYRPVGKKRLHQRPTWSQVQACRPWLRAEMAAVKPDVIVCLGATATQTLFGSRASIQKLRGEVFESEWAKATLVTQHPSALLRIPEKEARAEAYAALVLDLKLARAAMAEK